MRGVVHIGHVDSQASIFTEKDHGGALLLITGCVSDSYHILNLVKRDNKLCSMLGTRMFYQCPCKVLPVPQNESVSQYVADKL